MPTCYINILYHSTAHEKTRYVMANVIGKYLRKEIKQTKVFFVNKRIKHLVENIARSWHITSPENGEEL